MEPSPTPEAPARRTPLYDAHVRLGARMMAFGGYDMPVQYPAGILAEHRAVRESAGIFDVSHMAEIRASGPGALAFVEALVSNDAARMPTPDATGLGRAMYTVMCTDAGGIVADLLVYRMGADDFLLVVNAANHAADVAWMHAHNDAGARLDDLSDGVALLAIQGPKAFEIVARATGIDASDIPYYHFRQSAPGALFGSQMGIVSHTGYTGEAGLELYLDADCAVAAWDALLRAGADDGLLPCGLGARDTLRMEAGYSLYGNDLSPATTPLEAGLGWVTKFDKGDFVGRDALAAQKATGVPRRLVAFAMQERCIPRHDQTLVGADGAEIGVVTSGTQSPTLGVGIGMGYVPNTPAFTAPGSEVWVEQRGRRFRATVVRPPFHTAPPPTVLPPR